MKQESIFTKCSLGILIVLFLVLVNDFDFIQLIPFYADVWEQKSLIVISFIFSVVGLIKYKSKLGIFLTVINVILLFFPRIYWAVYSAVQH